jgi:hypothetical protein
MKHPLAEILHLTEPEARVVQLGLDRLRLIIHREIAAMKEGGQATEPMLREMGEDLDRLNLVAGKVAEILEYYANNKG